MTDKIYIPNKIKVGFQERSDTYSRKLAYIIYQDSKNVWRKEASWESWREKYISDEEFEEKRLNSYNKRINDLMTSGRYSWETKTTKIYTQEEAIKELGVYADYDFEVRGSSNDKSIQPQEFKNEPIEGFVLNKKAGGYSSGWNHRQTYCRVYDPRGFEFEISIPNLLYILENTNSVVGKGLEGKFVYGWQGKDLILIPENSVDYKEMQQFTNLQTKSVSTKDLIIGATYQTKQKEKLIYLGRFDKYDRYDSKKSVKKNQFYFWTGTGFTVKSSISILAECIDLQCTSEYSTIMDNLEHFVEYSPFDESKYVYVKVEDQTKQDYCYFINYLDNWYQISSDYTMFDPNLNPVSHDSIYLYNYPHNRVNVPHGMNRYNFIQSLGGFHKQIKYLANGKEAKFF